VQLLKEYPGKFVNNREKREECYNRIREYNSGISPIPSPLRAESEG
jgi:hypothetical protein